MTFRVINRKTEGKVELLYTHEAAIAAAHALKVPPHKFSARVLDIIRELEMHGKYAEKHVVVEKENNYNGENKSS
jgi:hypothetical protein